ncbi:MAG: outer membrane protein assembly factor BamA [Bacteroidota bacterium]|nr:outer membrane protein assembly factor BamA [Bacteroidota bacterium]MDX5431237.1 outer membrane protein assembly factor BamA [Bacteroidota bacterium]MDX5469976.1 outer membrane protein assembly factor BamA [Bacteroidota bacterium]
MNKRTFILLLIGLFAFCSDLQAQTPPDSLKPYLPLNYQRPAKYIIGGLEVEGVSYFDPNIVKLFSGLYTGQEITIPGDEITQAIENLWAQKLFTDVQILLTRVEGNKIYLRFVLQENPRLYEFEIRGLKKSKAKSLREEMSLRAGDMITDNLKQRTINEIKAYYVDKGYLNVKVGIEVNEAEGTTRKNMRMMVIHVDPGIRTKIGEIVFVGNSGVKERKLKKAMSETKEKGIRFKRSKFVEESYALDKIQLISYYNTQGYRDARILKDSIYKISENQIGIQIHVAEGPKYYFRNISWTGNTKYRTGQLDTLLGIKRGEVYDISRLEMRLYMSPNGSDVSSLYMDDGYLFFNIVPVETKVENDSIDIEIRINEGPQAIVNKILISGNTKTSDWVILREIRTRPGQKFSRSDIQRSVRELAALGYFDPEKIEVNPLPNYAAGTVDIEYRVEERPSDQIELSGGFGAGFIVGTLGLNLTNFSTKKMFNPKEWKPIPAGDGQRLSIRAQSNGSFFQSYNASFTEPWLGGKRPQSLSVSVFHSIQSNGLPKSNADRAAINITGVTVGVGRLLRKPDDYFSLSYGLTYQRYRLNNYQSIFSFGTGISDNLNFRIAISRNSVDQPIYPRSGSQFSLSLQITPPWSLFSDKNYAEATDQEKYRLIEYHKWKFDAAWYVNLVDKLVLTTQAHFGYMGAYNKSIGASPFERFYLGGAGLIGFNLDGRELIALRGYDNNVVTPVNPQTGNFVGGTIYNKFTAELRYPISLNPQATIYALVFAEAGNNFDSERKYNPFNVLRSSGGGVRVFLPMFGLLGLDYGYGFDPNPYRANTGKGQFHFFIGQQF